MTGGVLFAIVRIRKQQLQRKIKVFNARSVAFELIKSLSCQSLPSNPSVEHFAGELKDHHHWDS